MLHPDTEIRFIDHEIGYGVFALKDIPKGTITWVRDSFDMEFTPEQVRQFDPIHSGIVNRYCYRNRRGNFVLCWDFGRYINHSFRSNCLSTGYDFEIAVRDIKTGEELTDDYGYLNVSEPFPARDEFTERKYVYPDDLLHFHAEWDAQTRPVMMSLFDVNQPLLSLLSEEDFFAVSEAIAGRRELRSILYHYYQESAQLEAQE